MTNYTIYKEGGTFVFDYDMIDITFETTYKMNVIIDKADYWNPGYKHVECLSLDIHKVWFNSGSSKAEFRLNPKQTAHYTDEIIKYLEEYYKHHEYEV